MTWDKLKLELDMLATENPTSLLPLLLGLHSYLWQDEAFTDSYKQLNFMNYELSSHCVGLSDLEKHAVLNDFFFEQKEFAATSITADPKNEKLLLVGDFLTYRTGLPLIVSVAYSHFASQLDLPIYLTSKENPHILKWIRGTNRSEFINTLTNGTLLTEEEVIKLTESSENQESCFDILPAKDILTLYLNTLTDFYSNTNNKHGELDTLNISVRLHPNNLNYLTRRALTHKELGNFKEAICDLKRYFSFIDRTQASPEIKMAYYELHAYCSDRSLPETIH